MDSLEVTYFMNLRFDRIIFGPFLIQKLRSQNFQPVLYKMRWQSQSIKMGTYYELRFDPREVLSVHYIHVQSASDL
jgi:hypothetical protein